MSKDFPHKNVLSFFFSLFFFEIGKQKISISTKYTDVLFLFGGKFNITNSRDGRALDFAFWSSSDIQIRDSNIECRRID